MQMAAHQLHCAATLCRLFHIGELKHLPYFLFLKVYSQKIDPTNQMPAAANQQPATNQAGTLDTARVTSNIPKAGTDDGAWVYPSPQMVKNVYHVI